MYRVIGYGDQGTRYAFCVEEVDVGNELTTRQDLSKTLFGQVHRLDVMLAIIDSNGLVNPTDLSVRLGLAQSALQAPLRDLLKAGLLEYVDVQRRRNIYRRVDESLGWAWAEQLRAQADSEEQQKASNVREIKGSAG